jgi:GT2 family glycosyltransferase
LAISLQITNRPLQPLHVKTAVVIPTYNGQKWIEKCLQSVGGALPPLPDVWVVDNASQDETRSIIQSRFAAVHLVAMESNVGFAAAVNEGIRRALAGGAEVVILLNQDMHVREDWLLHLLSVAAECGPVGIFSPLELNYDGTGIDPGNRQNLADYVPQFTDDMWLGRVKTSYPTRLAYGGAMMIHREVFELIGFFDEIFFMYGEDIDFCRRARWCDVPIWFVPFSVVFHYSSMSSHGSNSPWIQRLNRRVWYILDLKDPKRPFWLNLLIQLRGRVTRAATSVIFRRFQSFSHCVSDWCWLVANACRIRQSRQRDEVFLRVWRARSDKAFPEVNVQLKGS